MRRTVAESWARDEPPTFLTLALGVAPLLHGVALGAFMKNAKQRAAARA